VATNGGHPTVNGLAQSSTGLDRVAHKKPSTVVDDLENHPARVTAQLDLRRIDIRMLDHIVQRLADGIGDCSGHPGGQGQRLRRPEVNPNGDQIGRGT
jgi:hypothetical protein